MKRILKSSFLWLAVVTVSALSGCGGGGGGGGGGVGGDTTAPTIVSTSPEGGVLGKDEAIVVRFSESMATTSLAISGDLADESATAEWSQTVVANDTVTFQPASRWRSGHNRSYTLNVTDSAGNALTPESSVFLVPMEFDNFQAAELVIGQADFTTAIDDVNASTLSRPFGNVAVSNGQLIIGDFGNNRVLGYNDLPQINGAAADFVLGQTGFLTKNSGLSRSEMSGPQQICIENDIMALVEYDNSRVLIYNSIPTDGSALPDVVVGQSDFTGNDTSCDAAHINSPETVAIAGGKLVVTDSGHNRVLIWNSVPTLSGQAPDLVLGQNASDTCAANDDDHDGSQDAAPTERTMWYPAGLWSDGTRLIVLDTNNSRALIWNSFPTEEFQPADIVLGQADFTLNAGNDSDADGISDVPSAAALNSPYDGVWSNGVQIFLADTNNNRVLIWNSWPERNFEPADTVLGQSDFIHYFTNDVDQDGSDDGPDATVFTRPSGVFGYEDLLFVSDEGNNRILVFRSH